MLSARNALVGGLAVFIRLHSPKRIRIVSGKITNILNRMTSRHRQLQ